MLEHSFYDQKTSKVIEKSVENVLENGFRTKDICQDDTKEVSTSDMGELICEEFKSLSKNI
jgi:3-isopropylmalate dehydrogenase